MVDIYPFAIPPYNANPNFVPGENRYFAQEMIVCRYMGYKEK